MAQAAAKGRHPAPLAGDVARLSEAFTTGQGERRSGYLNAPPARRAYLGHFVPLNAARVALLVRRLADEGHLELEGIRRVADVGAGPLSASLGLLALGLDVQTGVGVDLSRAALDDGLGLLEQAFPGRAARFTTHVVDLRERAQPLKDEGPFDLIVMANALGELKDGARGGGLRRAVVEGALRALSRGGRLLVVEPATRKHARPLQRLRDELVLDRAARVLSPCPAVEACPLLAGEDWCHQDLPWRRPDVAAALEREAGLDNRRLQLSHLLLAAPERRGRATPDDDDEGAEGGLRLLSDPMGARGRTFRLACSPAGLVRLVRKGATTTESTLPAALVRPARGTWLDEAPRGVMVRGVGRPRGERPDDD